MLTTLEDRTAELARDLCAGARPEKVILFGSRARGDARPESDYDILVVQAESNWAIKDRRLEITRLRRLLRSTGTGIDVLLYTPEEFERLSKSRNDVVGRASREGRVLYER